MSSTTRGLFVLVLGALVVGGCTASPAPLAVFGMSCSTDAACASGMCDTTDFFCTEPCSAAEPCGPGGFVCGPAGVCEHACSERTRQGSGASTQICVDGLYVPCAGRDPTADCDVCGCEPFGGGMCVATRGCVVPQPDGAPCTADVDCTSHVCYRDTHVCGVARAMGAPCLVDVECVTLNCSTDGDTSAPGHCNQEFESECTSTGPTCTNCDRWDSILPAVCARAHCGPEAPCPQLGDPRRVWSCEMSTDGTHRCFEHCTDGSYHCFDGARFCRSGFCG